MIKIEIHETVEPKPTCSHEDCRETAVAALLVLGRGRDLHFALHFCPRHGELIGQTLERICQQ